MHTIDTDIQSSLHTRREYILLSGVTRLVVDTSIGATYHEKLKS